MLSSATCIIVHTDSNSGCAETRLRSGVDDEIYGTPTKEKDQLGFSEK